MQHLLLLWKHSKANDEPLTKLQRFKSKSKGNIANDDISTYGLEDETNKVTNINVLAVMVEYNDVNIIL